MSAWEDDPSGFDSPTILRPVDIDDDESNLKDNWDDDDEEEAPKPTPKPAPKKPEKKKKLQPEEIQVLTPEQQAQLKIEAEKKVREGDLELAKEAFGVKINASEVSFTPSTSEQFDSLKTFLVTLLSSLSDSPHFSEFTENLIRDFSVSVDLDVLKRMTEITSAVLSERNKQKQLKARAKKAVKGIKLRVDEEIRNTGEDDLFGGENEDGEDYYDDVADKYDFM